MHRPFVHLVKCLLGVRNTTPSSLCLVEIGLNTCQREIIKKKKSFLKSKLSNVDYYEPFHVVYDMCRLENTPDFKMLSRCLECGTEGVVLEQLKQQIHSKPTSVTKFSTYILEFNTDLEVHKVYTENVYTHQILESFF